FCFLNSILPSPLLHYSFHSLDNNTALTSFPTRRSSDLRKRSVNIFSKEKTLVIKSLTLFNIYYIIFRLHLYLNKLVTSKYLNQCYQRNRLAYLLCYRHHLRLLNCFLHSLLILVYGSHLQYYLPFLQLIVSFYKAFLESSLHQDIHLKLNKVSLLM